MAARQHYQASSVSVTTTDDQRECARDRWCSAITRDEDGEWRPAPAAQHICPADQDVMTGYLGELPHMYERLGEMLTDPARRTRPVRVSPGSRVLVSGDADELMHDVADWIGAWAIRVRAVPQLRLSRPEALYGTPERVAADCGTLAGFPGPMLALELKDALRTWTFPPPRLAAGDPPPPVFRLRRPRPSAARPRPVPCRRCRLPVSPSPSGKYWWPAECTHAAPLLPGGERDDDGRDDGLLCSACGKRLRDGWQPAPPCRHEASGVPLLASPIPAYIEEEIGDLEVVCAGDGWVQCLTPHGGREAALDVFDLRDRAYRMLRENPAPRDLLDGIPCRRCDAMSSLEMLPLHVPGPEHDREGKFCRCSVASCHDEMTRPEYDQWVAQYRAWAEGAGVQSCRRCARGDHPECRWQACQCRASGHRNAA